MTETTPSQMPDQFPAEAGEITLYGQAGAIEALVDIPEREDERPVTAIICHPHSLHGGTMRNKVVTMIERALRESGARTLRFNFRGVGESEGEFAEGTGEAQDLLLLAEWVRRCRPDDQLWLAGFSFGSYVAFRAAQHLPLSQLVLIAPPVESWDFSSIAHPGCPWLVVQGDDDEVVSPDLVYAWVEALDDPPQLVRMEETSHFFHRRLMDLRGVIKNGVRAQLPARSYPEETAD